MNRLFVAALFSALFLPNLSWSQDAFTPAAFEKIVTEDLKKDFFKNATKFFVVYDIKDTPYYVAFNSDKKYLLFYAKQRIAGIDLQKVNDWNKGAIYSRVYIVGDATYFEVPLSFAAGVTKPVVLHYYNKFEDEYREFRIFVEKK